MNDPRRTQARERALATARAITLGLVVGTASGCEQLADRYCRTFDASSYCCAHNGGTWDAASGACAPPTPAFAMPGPFVPPSARA